MNLKRSLLTLLLIPVVIGVSVGIMILSYLVVPVTIVTLVGLVIYLILKMRDV